MNFLADLTSEEIVQSFVKRFQPECAIIGKSQCIYSVDCNETDLVSWFSNEATAFSAEKT